LIRPPLMDPFSIITGSLQVASVCSQCTITIIKWVGDVRTVDQRIRGFYDEVIALKATYEGLEESLRSPLMVEAARVANQTSDGAHLWTQVRIALDDSTKTMKRIKHVLDDISKHTGPLRRVKSQLTESLTNGELSRLRQRIQFFNATISLPIQMVCVMLQLEQRGMSTEHQRQLDAKFASIELTMRQLIQQLSQPNRTPTMMSGSTLIVGTTDDAVDAGGRDNYLSFAKKILSTASAAASTRAASTQSSQSTVFDAAPLSELGGGGPPAYAQHQHDRRRTIPDWIPAPTHSGTDLLTDLQSPTSLASPESPVQRSKSYEVAYKLAHTHLKLGQEKADQENHESAERSFRKALGLLKKHDFSGRIAFQPAEVVLLLSHSCLQQKKYAEAIDLLKPVAARQTNIFPRDDEGRSPDGSSQTPAGLRPDTLQALAASHMLGEVYRQQGDFEQAKEHALKAFMERTDELGEQDAKTLESVRLVIGVYRDMGDEEEAEAYEVFLTPAPPAQRTEARPQPPREVAATEDETVVASLSPPASDIAAPTPLNRPSRTSFATRLRNIGRTSQPNVGRGPSNTDVHRYSFSRATTLEDTFHETVFLPAPRIDTRRISSPSETSHEPTSSFFDDASTAPSSARIERSPSIKTLEPTFQAVQQLCAEGKFGKAIKIAISFLETYNSRVFIIRKDALEKNIREGGSKGLAATGHGYSPIHFFCELKEECVDEVSLLIKYGVDVNAVAYKAGFTGTTSPHILTPLNLSINKGHTNIAKLILESKDLKPDMQDGDGLYPLLAACRKQNYTVVKGLLNHAPKSIPRQFPTSWYGNSVLHDAARHCDPTLVDILLDTGLFDIDQQDKFGKTPLMHAVIKSDVNNPFEKAKMVLNRQVVVERLLEAGADKSLMDHKSLTAKAYADRERESEGSRELISVLGNVRYEMA
jgi:tetratricopeptide (TPR) repeat protein